MFEGGGEHTNDSVYGSANGIASQRILWQKHRELLHLNSSLQIEGIKPPSVL